MWSSAAISVVERPCKTNEVSSRSRTVQLLAEHTPLARSVSREEGCRTYRGTFCGTPIITWTALGTGITCRLCPSQARAGYKRVVVDSLVFSVVLGMAVKNVTASTINRCSTIFNRSCSVSSVSPSSIVTSSLHMTGPASTSGVT